MIDPFVTLKEVCYVTGLSPTEIMGDGTPERPGRVALGTFPKPACKSGPHKNSKWFWRLSAIIAWMAEQEIKYPWTPPKPAIDNTPPKEGDVAD